jgi:hypothetical protein
MMRGLWVCIAIVLICGLVANLVSILTGWDVEAVCSYLYLAVIAWLCAELYG